MYSICDSYLNKNDLKKYIAKLGHPGTTIT